MGLHQPTLIAGLAAAAAGLAFLLMNRRFSLRLKESIELFRARVGETKGPAGGFSRVLLRILFPFLGILFMLLGAALIYRAL